MAEAEVEASNSNRFFCHKCTAEITPKLPDYVCPRCNSGFIEILEGPQDSDSDSSSEMDFVDFIDVFTDGQSSHNNTESSPSSGGSSSGPRRSQRFRNTLNPRHGRRRYGHDRQQAMAPIIQEVIMHMTSSLLGSSVGGADLGMLAEGIEIPAPIPMLVTSSLASNPGDYAWGRGGLDAIITQLMNQLDGTGPPPLPQEKINQIPTVKIIQEQCDKNLQCTVCMEDFKLDEQVRKLNCEHCYHEGCIIPWLQLHATCPICRKALTGDLRNDPERIQLTNIFGSSQPSQSSGNSGTESVTNRNSGNNRTFGSSNSSRLDYMEEELD